MNKHAQTTSWKFLYDCSLFEPLKSSTIVRVRGKHSICVLSAYSVATFTKRGTEKENKPHVTFRLVENEQEQPLIMVAYTPRIVC